MHSLQNRKHEKILLTVRSIFYWEYELLFLYERIRVKIIAARIGCCM